MMLHILAKRHIHRLAEFAWSNTVVGFDYDGTLAPIVHDPALARMRAKTRRLLGALARRYPCVVISGRAWEDLVKCVGSVPVWHLAGNHGLEPWAQDANYATQVREWVPRLEARLASHAGVTIEDKIYSVTIHYHRARNRRRALAVIGRAVRMIGGARVLGGNHAVSLVPRGAPHKGSALERARRLLVCDTAIYVGDDDTDEDVFGTRSDRLLGIRIGRAPGSRAAFCLTRQEEIDDLLRALLAFRPLGGGRRH